MLVLGAGSFALEVMDLCSELMLKVEAFVVNVDKQPETLNGVPVIHTRDLKPGKGYYVVGTIWPERAKLAAEVEAKGYRPLTLIHPWTSVSAETDLQPGCLIGQGATIARGTRIEKGVIVNRGAIIGHDCILKQFSTVGPGAILTANATLEDGATVCMGVSVRENVIVGAGAVVGMGSVLLHDVPVGETWWGNPARRQR